jgi:hypothetical protein
MVHTSDKESCQYVFVAAASNSKNRTDRIPFNNVLLKLQISRVMPWDGECGGVLLSMKPNIYSSSNISGTFCFQRFWALRAGMHIIPLLFHLPHCYQ